MKITLIKGGGGDTYYELGLLSGLITQGIFVDFIGSDRDILKHTDILRHKSVAFFNFRGNQDAQASMAAKIVRLLTYYIKLLTYALRTNSKIFHIQWTEKFVYFDRTVLNIYYKLLGKKLVFTAHNVNAAERDGNDNVMNRLTLKFMYRTVDHIIVHTDRMKKQLVADYGLKNAKVTVIKYGINNMVPISRLTYQEARKKLHIDANKKVILFFGKITAYKGLEYLIIAASELKAKYNDLQLIIAGRIASGENSEYWGTIENLISANKLKKYIILRTEFTPDEEVETYFKAADVLVLPYKYIFQSGVLFLSYAFGLPVIATDVGSLKEYIIEEKTGFVCQPADAIDLARKIDYFFNSDLFINLAVRKKAIIDYVNNEYSWKKIGAQTKKIYDRLCRD